MTAIFRQSPETFLSGLRHVAGQLCLVGHPLSLAGTSVFLNRLVNTQKGGLLRIKGTAGLREKAGKPAVIPAVQDK